MSATTGTPERRAKFGLYEANFASGELRKNGAKLKLQEQPFQVLALLLDRAGQVVTREEIQQKLWPADTFVDFDHSLNTAINKLRDVLGDTASNPRFIETLPRRGYRFIAPVEWNEPSVIPSGAAPSATESKDPSRQTEPSIATIAEPELPQADHRITRLLFGGLQLMYLIFYACGLWRLDEIGDIAEDHFHVAGGKIEALVLVTAVIGIALRLYTLSATGFNYRLLGAKFRKLIPLVYVLDLIWAFSPFLLQPRIGLGLAFAACAALLYSPFAQRILAMITWPAK
ncbi:winged helix-turn-helix domain-containing protein [Candidatus Korobacter versatilis]|nr:winged helix-turn-helix domain-containing protein [Candidatus Koribacter versatilis]